METHLETHTVMHSLPAQRYIRARGVERCPVLRTGSYRARSSRHDKQEPSRKELSSPRVWPMWLNLERTGSPERERNAAVCHRDIKCAGHVYRSAVIHKRPREDEVSSRDFTKIVPISCQNLCFDGRKVKRHRRNALRTAERAN